MTPDVRDMELELERRYRELPSLDPATEARLKAGLLEHADAPGRPRPSRRAGWLVRRPVLAACVVLLVACGIALAANISVRYFESGSQLPPKQIRVALEFAAVHLHPSDSLALGDTVQAYIVTSANGRQTVYMAPYAHRQGFCAALHVAGKPVRAGCTLAGGTHAIAALSAAGYQPWDIALTPDLHALLGRLAPRAAGDRVEMTFEDHTRQALPMHGRWFAYAIAGRHTQAGHRPQTLRIYDHARLVRSIPLQPESFNTLAAARALVPPSDGTRGQDAIRSYLLRNLTNRFADGGMLASHTSIASTRLVAKLTFPDRLSVAIYAAPVEPATPGRPGGSIIIGLASNSARPILVINAINPRRGRSFEGPGGCRCAIPGHLTDTYNVLTGNVPNNVTRVSIRTTRGKETAATLFNAGQQWIWIGRSIPTQHPTRLVGRNARGAVIVTRALRGQGGLGP
jgi:hypothetical protein